MDHVLRRMSEKSGCGVLFGTVRITDVVFADGEVLAEALESLSEEAEPLELRVSSKFKRIIIL